MIKYSKYVVLLISLFLLSCAEDEPEWSAADVCPETGMNAYGIPNRGTFVDERDGREYKYTTIGNQVWMAENLKYELPNPYSTCYGKEFCVPRGLWLNDTTQICNTDTTRLAEIAERLHSACETNECVADEFCEKYGRFYTLIKDAKTSGFLDRDIVDSVCPKGWHVPTKVEWETLFESVDGVVNRLLKEEAILAMEPIAIEYQRKDGGPIDACGFSMLYAGYYDYSGGLSSVFRAAYFTTSTMINTEGAYAVIFDSSIGFRSIDTKKIIRCIKD